MKQVKNSNIFNSAHKREAFMTCTQCKKTMRVAKAKMPDGIGYEYYKCSCGEEVLDMEQLHEVAEKYRKMKRHYAKISKWGQSLGLRIPKELSTKYKLTPKSNVAIIDEEDGLKLVVV